MFLHNVISIFKLFVVFEHVISLNYDIKESLSLSSFLIKRAFSGVRTHSLHKNPFDTFPLRWRGMWTVQGTTLFSLINMWLSSILCPATEQRAAS